MINALIMVMLIASALLAYSLRRKAVVCLATLAFLPFVPAALRYALADSTIVNPDGDAAVRYMLLGAINYGAVWSGFVAALLFDLLAGGRAASSEMAPTGRDQDQSPTFAPDEDWALSEEFSGKSGSTHDAA